MTIARVLIERTNTRFNFSVIYVGAANPGTPAAQVERTERSARCGMRVSSVGFAGRFTGQWASPVPYVRSLLAFFF
jgi:hypothetical protein